MEMVLLSILRGVVGRSDQEHDPAGCKEARDCALRRPGHGELRSPGCEQT